MEFNKIEDGRINGLDYVIVKASVDPKAKTIANITDWYNGYVGVEESSKLWGEEYYTMKLEDVELTKIEESLNDIHVHGGLTFSGLMDKGEKGVWYFGFDTNHAGDGANEQNRDYVFDEITKLSEQINKLTK